MSIPVWLAMPACVALVYGFAATCMSRAFGRAARVAQRRECRAVAAMNALLAASRRSSADVLATFDRELRCEDERIDSVAIFVPDGEMLRCAYAAGERIAYFDNLRIRRDDVALIAAKAAALGYRAAMPHDGNPLLPTDRFAIAVPMIEAGALRSVTYVSSVCEVPSMVGDAIVRAVERASAPYAIALEREIDRADATYDGLTGLLTSRAFRRRLEQETKLCAARGRPLAVWFVDTDSFKAINDAFGHRTGDAVLQALAELLAAHVVPELDVAGRNGGDEFCVLLRDAGKAAAIARAQAFCQLVRSHDFGLPIPLTASIGIAAFPRDATTSSDLLETADGAMYHAKRSGRNCVAFVAQPGRFARVRPEAEHEPSRTSNQWRCEDDELFGGSS